MTWRHYLRAESRSPTFLWRMMIAILLTGAMVGAVVPRIASRPERSDASWMVGVVAAGRFEEVAPHIDALFDSRQTRLPRLLSALPALHAISRIARARGETPLGDVRGRLAVMEIDQTERDIALALWDSLSRETPSERLEELTTAEPPLRYAHWALGIYWKQRGHPTRAAEAYQREGRFAEASPSRRRALEIYVRQQDIGELERLETMPGYAQQFPPAAVALVAAEREQWWRLWWILPTYEWSHLATGPMVMAALTALFWLIFCLHAGQVTPPAETRWWLCVMAIGLGVVSIWPTDYLIFWQERVWNLAETGDLAGGLRFYILGVGLREELSKLVCLLPLLPWLVRRGKPLETLIVSACVGLGFAAAENTQYFAETQGASSVSRFLTANFFHMAATGLIGLAICRAIWHPRNSAAEFLALFTVIVAAHGLYDALISLPDLAGYQIGSTIIYVLLCYQFFQELRAARSTRAEMISLTATFLFAVSCLGAVTFVYLSANVGWQDAWKILAPEAIGMAVMVYLFLREMPETLVTV
ncbi:MAG: PrsW family glutamic-type intramembrane protease [Pirellulales bacterium]